jgi:hypothetical protein
MRSHNKRSFSFIEKIASKRGYVVDENGILIGYNGNQLSNHKDKQGYVKCTVSVDGKNITLYAHRLMAYQKYRDRIYEKGNVVRHLDNNKTNNKPENIEIGTCLDNLRDMPIELIRERQEIATRKTIKYNRDEVVDYYNKCGRSRKKTMEHFNISSAGTLHYILSKRKYNSSCD